MPSSFNPITGEKNYDFDYTSEEDFNQSLQLLRSNKSHLDPFERSQILFKLKELVSLHKQELAKLIHVETGKDLAEAAGEVERALITLQVSAEEAKRINGEAADFYQHTPTVDNKLSLTKRFPLGVIFCITPFNFPLNLAMHKIAPAFAAGNSILLKPSDFNFQFGQRLVELCHQAGMPQDRIQYCLPSVETLNKVISDPRIDAISFTGGTKTADKIASLAGRKKLLFELGGNGAFVVMPQADLELVKKYMVSARLSVNGQTCTSSKRFLIHEKHYQELRSFLIDQLKHLDARALISEQAAIKVEELVSDAVEKGATLTLGGMRKGALFPPTIVENIPPKSELIIEETFGPVFSLIKFKTESEAFELVNATPYGLQAGVFTNDIEQAKRAFEQLEVGSIGINLPPGFRQEQHPFGGVKSSGNGREGIKYAINEMTYIKQMVF